MNTNYRKGVGIFLLNKTKDVWIGKRVDVKSEFWQMPQGGVDKNESFKDAMYRELDEEIGTNNVMIIDQCEKLYKYDLPENIKNKVWNGKYIGQIQQWFACLYLGNDDEVNLKMHKPEFCEWKWIRPQEIINLVVPFKKEMYKKILDSFKHLYS
ncbi:MAG: RNA pyrophosphohydrolase [Rickettsiales bacterium]|nr:RNA pyrophosphohydrolase [Rickettsiales bacterium]OUV54555.1 MAG: RNA pyrophosphohydrolase [Rickettsiales bacterium TMED127]|tara:strand:- start:25463 stop:25924 length:462 start_codon:yes stop_codon:yes gene_type:complete